MPPTQVHLHLDTQHTLLMHVGHVMHVGCARTHPASVTACCPPSELAKLLGNRTRALLTFEDPSFTVEGFLATYLGQLSEKAIDNARQDLGALLATCTEEVRMCASVWAASVVLQPRCWWLLSAD
jgi:hypothetical protein